VQRRRGGSVPECSARIRLRRRHPDALRRFAAVRRPKVCRRWAVSESDITPDTYQYAYRMFVFFFSFYAGYLSVVPYLIRDTTPHCRIGVT